jgi:hypothetical protein
MKSYSRGKDGFDLADVFVRTGADHPRVDIPAGFDRRPPFGSI